MKIHDRMIAAFISINGGIGMQTDNEVVSLLLGDFQEIQVPHVEEIECTCHVHDFITRLWTLAVAELYDFLCGRQKLRTAGPRTPGGSILTHALTRLSVDAVFVVTLSKVLPCHQQHTSYKIGR